VGRYNQIMKIFYTILVVFFNIANLHSENYKLEWTGDMKFSKSITYQDKSIFKIVHPSGYWEDSEGNYGNFSCIGWVKSVKDNESLEVNCEAIDNEKDKFWVILNRNSDIGAGVGKTTYIDATGKYKKHINKECKYAINYFQAGFFYKQLCK